MVFSVSSLRSARSPSPIPSARSTAAALTIVAAVFVAAVTVSSEERRFRPPDDRPAVQADALARAGIRGFSSERLSLYADIDPEIARALPPLADQLYDQLVATFGPPLPDPDGKPFGVTAFLMKDRQPFLGEGLIPSAVRSFRHGQHLGYAFWMDDQESPYYRRHLLLHEYAHCFMLAERPAVRDRPELWYLEGMAEVFGTHRLDRNGKLVFDIMPRSTEEVLGIGRIEMIEKAVARGDFHSVRQVRELGGQAFSESRSDPYAWGWALCHFLGNHPRYRERFRQLHTHRTDGEFAATFESAYGEDAARLEWDWEWFITDLTYGLELSHAGLTFAEGEPLGTPRSVQVDSRGNWQSTGVRLTEGESISVSAEGRVTLNATTRPWISEPGGITIEYEGGVPIGCLVGWILPDSPETLDHAERTAQVRVGTQGTVTATRPGTLYLRINDHPGNRSNNEGAYAVSLKPSAPGRNGSAR